MINVVLTDKRLNIWPMADAVAIIKKPSRPEYSVLEPSGSDCHLKSIGHRL